MLTNTTYEIKKAAGALLSSTAEIILAEDIIDSVLVKILQMAHDDLDEDNRIVAV
jgi:serine/threonine-protein phosphatase 4 regulatory subunit 1